MKKILLGTLFVMITATAAWSQVTVGLKAGINIAKESVSGSGITLSADNVVGFHGGAYLHAKFGKFGVQPEAYYSMTGSKFTFSGATDQIKTNYLSVPILLRFNVTDFFNIHAGPQFGILLSAKETSGGTTTDVKNQVKSGDFGLAFGAGFDLPMGFNGGVRYVAGMSNIDASSSSGSKTKNNVIQVYVGFKLFGK
jgi:hypothetical protein